jgi:hypothetical protein
MSAAAQVSTTRERQRQREAAYRVRRKSDPERLSAAKAAQKRWRAANPEKKKTYAKAKIKSYKRRKPWVFTVIAAKRRAKKYGMEFELSSAWGAERYALGSAISGLPFGEGPYAPSIDRIDSNLGYTLENSRLVLHAENLFKNQWSDAVIVTIAKAIARKASHAA